MKIWIGYDQAEEIGCFVARASMQRLTVGNYQLQMLHQQQLRIDGLYTRPQAMKHGRLWDEISESPMSTSHAIARFFIPLLGKADYPWALFTDGDVLFRRNVFDMMKYADRSKAIMVVKHDYQPKHVFKKMGDRQMQYPRKNWSSVMLWNLEHRAHERLTLEMLNTVPGRDLHRFCWLHDGEIGALPEEWNWLVRHSSSKIDPAIVHYTEGLPDVLGHEHDAYADEWRMYARRHADYTSQEMARL